MSLGTPMIKSKRRRGKKKKHAKEEIPNRVGKREGERERESNVIPLLLASPRNMINDCDHRGQQEVRFLGEPAPMSNGQPLQRASARPVLIGIRTFVFLPPPNRADLSNTFNQHSSQPRKMIPIRSVSYALAIFFLQPTESRPTVFYTDGEGGLISKSR